LDSPTKNEKDTKNTYQKNIFGRNNKIIIIIIIIIEVRK
jgi:hypothetical protein